VTYFKLSKIETKLGRNFITVCITLNFRGVLDPTLCTNILWPARSGKVERMFNLMMV